MRCLEMAGEGLRESHDHQGSRRADEQVVMAGQGDDHGKYKWQPGGHDLTGRSRGAVPSNDQPGAITAATSMP